MIITFSKFDGLDYKTRPKSILTFLNILTNKAKWLIFELITKAKACLNKFLQSNSR